MCQKFAQSCLSTEADSYQGTVIYQVCKSPFLNLIDKSITFTNDYCSLNPGHL